MHVAGWTPSPFYTSNRVQVWQAVAPPGLGRVRQLYVNGVRASRASTNASNASASKPETPRWDCVRLAYRGRFRQMLSLEDLRQSYEPDELAVVRRGNRLSILPVDERIARNLLERLGALQ